MEDIDNRIYQCALKEKNMVGGRVRIAVLTSLVSTILAKALKKYRCLYPDIRIEIKEGTPNEVLQWWKNILQISQYPVLLWKVSEDFFNSRPYHGHVSFGQQGEGDGVFK